MQSAKGAASNIAASAKSGMDKTKATVQEKVEKVTSHSPVEKDMATQRKLEKIDQAEWNKQATREHNAAMKQQSATTTTGHTTTTRLNPASALHGHGHGTTATGHTATTGLNPASALHGHGNTTTGHTTATAGLNTASGLHGHGTTGNPHGGVDEGAVGMHPIGTTTNTAANDPRLAGDYTQTGYGTGTGTGGAYR